MTPALFASVLELTSIFDYLRFHFLDRLVALGRKT
jgi:hypothetical protein